jgi:hypothetical protein
VKRGLVVNKQRRKLAADIRALDKIIEQLGQDRSAEDLGLDDQ